MKKISIIIPLYNCEKYIKRAIKSIEDNNLPNYEIIVVDDCSTDNSFKIVNECKKKNNNIKLYKNLKNMGAGFTKNRGISYSTGEYIGFLDSDDYVDSSFYSKMLDVADKQNSDIVISDIVIKSDTETYVSIYDENIFCNQKGINEIVSLELCFGNWTCVSACNKIFKNSLIKSIHFSEKVCDDLMFSIPALINAKVISYCEKNYYYYFQSDKSLTREVNKEKRMESFDCVLEALAYLNKKNHELAKLFAVNNLFPLFYICLRELPFDYCTNIIVKLEQFLKTNKHLTNENVFIKNSPLYKEKNFKKIIKMLQYDKYKELTDSIYNYENEVESRKKTLKNNNFYPKVSIVIPVYNGENYVEEAINSALSQTYKNIEILVVDDGSKDNTEEICKKYKEQIKYIKKENGGVASALNVAIDNMSGEYFSWLSHDDLYFEDKIEKQVNFLSHLNNKDVILFSNYLLINENGRKLAAIKINPKIYKNKKEYILLRGCINGITMLIPKKAFLECGKFDESLRCTQDYDCWHRFLKKYVFIQIEDYLSKTRVHSLQDTVSNPKAITEGEKLWRFMIDDVKDSRKIELEGSLYNYYYKMALHLRYSPYKETTQYCINKCKEINAKKYNKQPITTEHTNYLSKVIYCIREYGIIETTKNIIKKILRR